MNNLLTHSAEQCFMTCHAKYFWQYEKLWRPQRTAKALRIGTALHEALDVLAKCEDIEQAIAAVDMIYNDYLLEAVNWQNAEQGQYDLEIECVTVQCLVEGYHKAWAKSKIIILESEATFELPIVHPKTGETHPDWRQTGKRDRIGRLPDGRIALMETKTVSEDIANDSDYWTVLAVNQQISKYALAAQQEGIAVETVLYDVIRKPTIKPKPVPEMDKHGVKIIRDAKGERVLTLKGQPRQRPDASEGWTLAATPATAEQWRKELTKDIASRPDYYYNRREIPRLTSQLDEYAQEMWVIADDITRCRASGEFIRNTSACRKFNTLCPYYPLCAGDVDRTAGTPAGFRQAENAHEELQEAGEKVVK